jgi:signal transduction histidine kinase/CheY-like chemotaxis protein/HPt (histidine-containing phosphotransfer) domain-containing protein
MLGFLLAGFALVLFWLGSKRMFTTTLGTMDQLVLPDEKLEAIHNLYRRFNHTDYIQREWALKPGADSQHMVRRYSDSLMMHTLFLRESYAENDPLTDKLDSITLLLQQRQELFVEFIRSRSNLLSNKQIAALAEEITGLLNHPQLQPDTFDHVTEYQIPQDLIRRDTIVQKITIVRSKTFLDWLLNRENESRKDEIFTLPTAEDSSAILRDTSRWAIPADRGTDSIIPQVDELFASHLQLRSKRGSDLIWNELLFLKSTQQLNEQILILLERVESLASISGMEMRVGLYKKLSGDTFWGSFLLALILGILCLLAYLIVTDFVKANTYRLQLVEAREEAERQSRIKERFLSNMSHELRTPLQSIIGYSHLIREKAQPEQKEKEAILFAANHLHQIVNEILDYHRLVADNFKFELKPFHLYSTFMEVIEAMRVQMESKGLELKLTLDTDPDRWMNGDAFRLKQILYNLIGNAIKYTDEGEIHIRLYHVAQQGRNLTCLEISDTGIGISEEGKSRIFHSFEQDPTLNQERYGGTGLGLSIVKQLVDLMDGEIQLKSTLGQGSTFRITLPLAPVSPYESLADIGQDPAESLTSYSVALLDDDPLVLQFCETVLSAAGMVVYPFNRSEDFKKNLTRLHPDLVLTDIRLPDINGYQILEFVRMHQPQIPVIAMTAEALPSDRESLGAAGFRRLITKPFTAATLCSVLSDLIPQVVRTPANALSSHGADELLSLFCATCQDDLDLLNAFLRSDDQKGAQLVLHRLAGRCGQMGFEHWHQAFLEMEKALEENKHSLPAYRENLEQSILEIRTLIREERQEHSDQRNGMP